MTLKKQARKVGKEIRRATGIPLPEAMRAGKLLVRKRSHDIKGAVPIPFWCGIECCGWSGMKLVGPKGEFNLS